MGIGACLVLTVAATAAEAQTHEQIDWCENKGNRFSLDLAIRGCTALIQSGRAPSDKDLAMALYNRGHAYLNKNDHDRAIADYTEAIRLDPKDGRVFNNRGFAYALKGEYDRAIADYNEAIRLNPKDAKAFNGRGLAYALNGEYDRAIADYNEAIRLNPKEAQIFNGRGNAYSNKKEYDLAIADFSEAIRIAPELPEFFVRRCWARAQAGRALAEALSDCDEALRLAPNHRDVALVALGLRGLVHLKYGMFDRAIADYDAALKHDAKDAELLYGRGVAKLKSGDKAGGAADMAAAKAINANIAEVYAAFGVK
jgi:tetratricopeptide (TPR) repeat protein